jgi:hypothetical protein
MIFSNQSWYFIFWSLSYNVITKIKMGTEIVWIFVFALGFAMDSLQVYHSFSFTHLRS